MEIIQFVQLALVIACSYAKFAVVPNSMMLGHQMQLNPLHRIGMKRYQMKSFFLPPQLPMFSPPVKPTFNLIPFMKPALFMEPKPFFGIRKPMTIKKYMGVPNTFVNPTIPFKYLRHKPLPLMYRLPVPLFRKNVLIGYLPYPRLRRHLTKIYRRPMPQPPVINNIPSFQPPFRPPFRTPVSNRPTIQPPIVHVRSPVQPPFQPPVYNRPLIQPPIVHDRPQIQPSFENDDVASRARIEGYDDVDDDDDDAIRARDDGGDGDIAASRAFNDDDDDDDERANRASNDDDDGFQENVNIFRQDTFQESRDIPVRIHNGFNGNNYNGMLNSEITINSGAMDGVRSNIVRRREYLEDLSDSDRDEEMTFGRGRGRLPQLTRSLEYGSMSAESSEPDEQIIQYQNNGQTYFDDMDKFRRTFVTNQAQNRNKYYNQRRISTTASAV